MPSANTRVLSIVIPAYNEELAIASTIQRCLDACELIKETAHLDDIEIIVVSDGSSDRTVEIAETFPEVHLIRFEGNRGYGAAIKEGFRQSRGSLLGFIDADGTCDPVDFAEMSRVVVRDGADIVVGSRLGSTSEMPLTRKVGNHLFALMLGWLCGRRVTDTASGMRVVRRRALLEVYPLPDGMAFTPSMSARALLAMLVVRELPISYKERIGTSKLRVISDGMRFLWTIVEGVLCFRPERPFLMGAVACVLLSAMLGLYPVEYYLHHGAVLDWMIYRFAACFLLASTAFLLVCAVALAERMASLRPRARRDPPFWPGIAASLFAGRPFAILLAADLAVSLALLRPGIVEYLTTWHVSLHWSRLLTGMLGLLLGGQATITAILFRIIAVWEAQRTLVGPRPAAVGTAADEGSRSARDAVYLGASTLDGPRERRSSASEDGSCAPTP